MTQFSDTVLVIAMVCYIIAFALHSAEWGFARGLAAERASDGSEDAKRINVDLYGRLGVAATVVAVAANIVGVVARGIAAGRAPWGNMYEFVTAAMAFLGVLYLLCVWLWRGRWLGLGVTGLCALMMGLAITSFYVEVAPLMPALHSVWFIIHIVAAVLAAAAFNVAGVASVLYLVRSRAERKGEITGYLAKVPTSRRLDLFAHRVTAFAFPIWTFTIVAGAIWAQYAWGRFWNWDPKETWSFITWVFYAGYLHAALTAGWRGTRAAVLALIGLATFWFNFVGVNLLFSGLHSYSGI